MDSAVTADVYLRGWRGFWQNTTAVNPQTVTDCPPIPDPLAERAAPDVKGCDETDLVVTNEVRHPFPRCVLRRVDDFRDIASHV